MTRIEGPDALHARISRTPGASPEDARRTNRSLVLRALHLGGPQSRADLAKLIGVTPATVSSVVRGLNDDGIVEELGRTTARHVGKPATMIGIRPDGRHILAVDLSSHEQFVGALVDLDGKIVHRRALARRDAQGAAATALLVQLVGELVDAAERPLLGAGVASPGYVHPDGVISNATHLGWDHVDLVAALRGVIDVDIHVVNDANASALAELTYGDHDSDHIVVVRVDEGVGAGIVLGGQLHTGASGGGGEIGHVVIDPFGPRCVCGKRGCLETFVSAPLLAAASEPVPNALLAQTGRALGAGIAMLVSAVDADDVVISGSVEVLSDTFLSAVHDTISERTLPHLADRLTVRGTSFLDADVLLGAAALVLDRALGIR